MTHSDHLPNAAPPVAPSSDVRPQRSFAQGPPPSALLVDDDEAILRAHARALRQRGYRVATAQSGGDALEALQKGSFDVILSDIDMPGMNGVRLLEHVRGRDLDVPVVFITGAPSVDTAIKAVEYGALRYLIKPVEIRELVQVADDAVRLGRIAEAKRQAIVMLGGADRLIGDHAGLVASFGRAVDALYIDYQPIVSLSKRAVFAYEALMRSREPTMRQPGAILDAAERLGRLRDLGRAIRERATAVIEHLPADALLFLNLHPDDLLDDELYEADGPLAPIANRLVLELTERAPLYDIPDVRRRIAALRKLGFRIAVDDLGAGYAGLTSFALLEPDIVKLDMALVQGIHREPTKQAIVRTLIRMCGELKIVILAEGIETVDDRDELVRAGCDLMQGYLFARPGPPLVQPSF